MTIMKRRSSRSQIAWTVVLSLLAFSGALVLPSSGVAQSTNTTDPATVDRAYADVVMVDQFLATITGGAQGLPKMDQVNQAMIAKAIMEGDTEAAASRAYDYLVSKAAHAIGGAPASAALAAVGLGETLGMSAHEVFGEGRLRDLYADLSQDTNASAWPRSYAEAKQDDFVGGRFEIEVRPVMLWLKAQDDGKMSDSFYEAKAYHSMVAMRDFEMGCDQYGLEGPDRTPEKLQEALDDELGMAAARAQGAHSAELFLLEINRELVAAEDAARQAAAARFAAREAKEEEEAQALSDEVARLEAEATRAQAAADSMRVALLAEQAESTATTGAPAESPPEPSAESLGISLVNREQTGSDMTVFRVRLTNTGEYPIRGILPEVRAARLTPGGGVGWAGGEGLRILDPRASVELSFVGTGEIEAAVLYFSAQGQVLAARTFEVDHVTPEEAEPTPEPHSGGGEWIELPARYEGTVVESWTTEKDGQTLSDSYECRVSVSIDSEGAWTGIGHPCAVKTPQPVPGTEPGTFRLTSVPVSRAETEQVLTLRAEGGRVRAGSVTAAIEATTRQSSVGAVPDISVQAGPDHIWSRIGFNIPASFGYSLTFETTLERVR